eukprot:s1597_g21.t1
MDASGKPELVLCIFNSQHDRLSTSEPLCGCSLVGTMMASHLLILSESFGWIETLRARPFSGVNVQCSSSEGPSTQTQTELQKDAKEFFFTAAKCIASYQHAGHLLTFAPNLRATSCGNTGLSYLGLFGSNISSVGLGQSCDAEMAAPSLFALALVACVVLLWADPFASAFAVYWACQACLQFFCCV